MCLRLDIRRDKLHRPRVKNFVFADRAYLFYIHCDNIQRVAGEGKELDLITRVVAVNHDDNADVSGAEPAIRQVRGQHNTVMFANHISHQERLWCGGSRFAGQQRLNVPACHDKDVG